MDLAIELVASQWGLVVPVELVVELEMTVVLKEVVGVDQLLKVLNMSQGLIGQWLVQ